MGSTTASKESKPVGKDQGTADKKGLKVRAAQRTRFLGREFFEDNGKRYIYNAKPPIKQRIKYKMDDWEAKTKNILESCRPGDLSLLLDSLHENGMIGPVEKKRLQDTLELYNSNLDAKNAISVAVQRMLLDLLEDKKNVGKTSHINTVLLNFSEVFKNREIRRSIESTSNLIRKFFRGSDLVFRNIVLAAYLPEFELQDIHPAYNVFKQMYTDPYNVDKILCNIESVRHYYSNYWSYKKFFEDFGLAVPVAGMVVTPAVKELGKSETAAAVYYRRKIFLPQQYTPMDIWAVHEIAHSIQDTLGGLNLYEQPLVRIVAEGGAKFSEIVYELYEQDVRNVDEKSLVMKALNSRLKEYIGCSDTLKDSSLEELIERIFSATSKRSGNASSNLALEFYKDIENGFSNKFIIGLAVAALVYEANGYDIRRTIRAMAGPMKAQEVADLLAIPETAQKIYLKEIRELLY